LAPHKRSESSHPNAAPNPGRPHHSIKLNRRGQTLELLRAGLFDYKQAGEKPMGCRGYQHVVWAAAVWTRAAMLGASPNTSVSFPSPAPPTTVPESTPTLTETFGFVDFWLSFDSLSRIARAARAPRSASFS